MLTQLWADG